MAGGRRHRRRVPAEGPWRVFLQLPDGRCRPARGPRPAQPAARPHAEPVGQLLLAPIDRPAALAHHQRRRAGAARRGRDHRRPAAGVAGAGRLRRCCCSTTTRGWRWSASPVRRSSSTRWRSSAGACARRRAAARRRSSTCRTSPAESFAGHRIVKAFGAERREAARFAGASSQLYRTNMTVTLDRLGAAAADGVARRVCDCRRAVLRQPRDRGRPPDDRRVHGVHRGAAADVRPGEEAEPREREPAAGHRGGRACVRGARPPHGGGGEARRAAPGALSADAGVRRRRLRLRRRARATDPARRELHGARRTDDRDCRAAAAPARRRWST